jgi:hypothetical protein
MFMPVILHDPFVAAEHKQNQSLTKLGITAQKASVLRGSGVPAAPGAILLTFSTIKIISCIF